MVCKAIKVAKTWHNSTRKGPSHKELYCAVFRWMGGVTVAVMPFQKKAETGLETIPHRRVRRRRGLRKGKCRSRVGKTREPRPPGNRAKTVSQRSERQRERCLRWAADRFDSFGERIANRLSRRAACQSSIELVNLGRERDRIRSEYERFIAHMRTVECLKSMAELVPLREAIRHGKIILESRAEEAPSLVRAKGSCMIPPPADLETRCTHSGFHQYDELGRCVLASKLPPTRGKKPARRGRRSDTKPIVLPTRPAAWRDEDLDDFDDRACASCAPRRFCTLTGSCKFAPYAPPTSSTRNPPPEQSSSGVPVKGGGCRACRRSFGQDHVRGCRMIPNRRGALRYKRAK